MSRHDEFNAHAAMTDTAKFRALDVLSGEIRRHKERRRDYVAGCTCAAGPNDSHMASCQLNDKE